MRWLSAIAPILLLLGLARPAAAVDRFFITSDGVRLHYLEAGRGQTIVFVPGWTMPAWIFERQIAAFSQHYHVVAFDPRGQGDSAIPDAGYDPWRRGEDIAELISRQGPAPVLLVGWSLGVLDALSYVHQDGDSHLAGLVLIDNSVGEEPAPVPARPHPRRRVPVGRAVAMRSFVQSMFLHPPPADWLERLTETCLRVPEPAAAALLSYPVPRTYWKEALYSSRKPVLYVVRPGFKGQAANVALHDPSSETVVLSGVGHALFVDDAAGFNSILESFIRRRVWP